MLDYPILEMAEAIPGMHGVFEYLGLENDLGE